MRGPSALSEELGGNGALRARADAARADIALLGLHEGPVATDAKDEHRCDAESASIMVHNADQYKTVENSQKIVAILGKHDADVWEIEGRCVRRRSASVRAVTCGDALDPLGADMGGTAAAAHHLLPRPAGRGARPDPARGRFVVFGFDERPVPNKTNHTHGGDTHRVAVMAHGSGPLSSDSGPSFGLKCGENTDGETRLLQVRQLSAPGQGD